MSNIEPETAAHPRESQPMSNIEPEPKGCQPVGDIEPETAAPGNGLAMRLSEEQRRLSNFGRVAVNADLLQGQPPRFHDGMTLDDAVIVTGLPREEAARRIREMQRQGDPKLYAARHLGEGAGKDYAAQGQKPAEATPQALGGENCRTAPPAQAACPPQRETGKLIDYDLPQASADLQEFQGEDMQFQHSLLCQLALPRSRYKYIGRKGREEIFEYKTDFGRGSLLLQAGKLYDGKRYTQQPLPAGIYPRLISVYLNGESLRRNSLHIPADVALTKFMRRLGVEVKGGAQHGLIKREVLAYVACIMQLGWRGDGGLVTDISARPVERFDLWHRENEQDALLAGFEEEAVFHLSRAYFENLKDHAIPLDMAALCQFKSPLEFDIYSFLACRLRKLTKPILVTPEMLFLQFGQGYTRQRAFVQDLSAVLPKILNAYPSAKVEIEKGGFRLYPSPPPIKTRFNGTAGMVVSQKEPAQPAEANPAPPPPLQALPPPQSAGARLLREDTVKCFRQRYPAWDVYAAKDDYDRWRKEKTKPDPEDYDLAFLGFAKSWVRNRTKT